MLGVIMDEELARMMETEAPGKDKLKEGLKKAGFSSEQATKKIDEQPSGDIAFQRKHQKSLNTIFGTKEFFDRLAYGFAPTQFITILFFLTGAGPFIVGCVQALRDVLSGVFSSILSEYSKKKSMVRTTFIIFEKHCALWSYYHTCCLSHFRNCL
jgi:hypothetical protein